MDIVSPYSLIGPAPIYSAGNTFPEGWCLIISAQDNKGVTWVYYKYLTYLWDDFEIEVYRVSGSLEEDFTTYAIPSNVRYRSAS